MRVRHVERLRWAVLTVLASLAAVQGAPSGWPAYLREFTPPAGRSWAQYRVRDKDGMPQTLVPAGEFQRGAVPGDALAGAEEKPRSAVTVSAYWLDLHPVTNAQFAKFVAATGWGAGPEWRQWSSRTSPLHPAVLVSWDDAVAYAIWVGGKLPTEAQWERAARGGRDGQLYPWGSNPDPAKANGDWDKKREWWARDAVERFTEPVCHRWANAFGLYDMCGNVSEWCRDWYSDAGYSGLSARDPENTTPSIGHAIRGGTWRSAPRYLRISARDRLRPDVRYNTVGFRCVQAP